MIEIKGCELYVKGKSLKRYREWSNSFQIAKFIVKNKNFLREEIVNFCISEEISIESLDVEIYTLNKAAQEFFGEDLLIKKEDMHHTYLINPVFLKEKHRLIEVYLPQNVYEELKDKLTPYLVKGFEDENY